MLRKLSENITPPAPEVPKVPAPPKPPEVPEEPGFLDRHYERGVGWLVENLVSPDKRQSVMDSYRSNRNIWNTAITATGVLGATALGNMAANAFSTPKQQENKNPFWSWIAPIGILGGGAWLLNKYGDTISNAVKGLADWGGRPAQERDAVVNAAKLFNRFGNKGQK